MDKRAKERVAIAKDALEWLEAGALVATKMCYVGPERYPTDAERSSGKQLRDIVLGKCNVCALGGLLIAKAVRYDQVVVSEWGNAGNTTDGPLTQHFDSDQLKLIEAAFEGWNTKNWGGTDMTHYLEKYPDAKKRMTAVLRNIIRNKGTFRP